MNEVKLDMVTVLTTYKKLLADANEKIVILQAQKEQLTKELSKLNDNYNKDGDNDESSGH